MAVEREALRDWHRMFGLLLSDFFSGSPFIIEVERDLSGLSEEQVRQLLEQWVAGRPSQPRKPRRKR